MADREQLFRVFLNLGRNALEAMNGAGEVGVSARRDNSRDNDTVVIDIADTGPGMSQRARDRVGEALALPGDNAVIWRNEVAADFSVMADREQLFRVFLNLGRNALEAMNGAGEVGVSARRDNSRDNDTVVIDIADTGPGMSQRARDHLFEPFAGSDRHSGTGLGLPIAREIMRAHGGDLSVAKSDATGTVLRLVLPVD